MDGRRAAGLDALLYAASALLAVGAAWLASIPEYREWGRIAAGPYAAGCLGAVLLSRRRAGVRARAWLAVAVFAGAALAPLAAEVAWRANTAPGLHAQSEVLVTEEAAKSLFAGRDPYAATFLHGSLAARPLGTKTHFPYLPGMLAFGVTRALDGRSPLSDARLPFAAATLAAFGLAAARWPGRSPGRLRTAQVLLVLPTGALLMATVGDDLPVLGLMLASLVLAEDGRTTGSGIAAGLAAGLKQTAWLLLPFLVLAWGPARRRAAALAAAVAGVVVIPFIAWNPGAFVEDAIRFPLGLGRERSAAGTPTLGSAVVRALPGARAAVVLILLAIAAGIGLWLLVRAPHRTAPDAARNAGLLFAVALVLAPAARAGYVVYPLNLLAWAWLLRGTPGTRRSGTVGEAGRTSAIPST